jgi:hypothetical protein
MGGEERAPDQAPKYGGRRRKTPLTWLWGASGGCGRVGGIGGRGGVRLDELVELQLDSEKTRRTAARFQMGEPGSGKVRKVDQ